MSRMLNVVDHLLSRGRHLHRLGREQDALTVLRRLASFRQLPCAAAEETQARLADIFFHQERYRQARRHLKAVLVQQPENARYHHLMGAALAADPRADQHRAIDHYRRSLQLDPEQPIVLAEFGRLAVRLGQTDEGLGALCRAVELAPADAEIVSHLVSALREAGRPEEAKETLRAAMFRNAKDHRFRDLWNDYLFGEQCEAQATARQAIEAQRREEEGPTILPFVRPEPETTAPRLSTKRIRRDRPSPLRPPHLPRLSPLPDRKHA